MTDARGYGLVVSGDLRLFGVEGKVFEPEENYTKYSIAGEKFHLADGVGGMALSPVTDPDNNRYLFFRPLASKSLYTANSHDLANVQNRKRMNYFGSIDILPSQASSLAFFSDATLFCGLTKEIAVSDAGICVTYPLTPNYLVRLVIYGFNIFFFNNFLNVHNLLHILTYKFCDSSAGISTD